MKKIRFLPMILLLLLAFFTMPSCTKDPIDEHIQPPPVDTGTLKMSFNGAQILTTTYYTEVDPGGKAHFVWDYNGKVPFEILKNEQFFSDKVKGDTTIEIAEAITFTFLVQGNLIPQKIGVAIKNEPTPPSITSFTASSSSITRGDSIVLTLIHNGDTCAITSNPIGTLKSVSTEKVRTMKVAPTVNTRYTAESWNKYGSVFAFVDVIVNDPPMPTKTDFLVMFDYFIEDSVWFYEDGAWVYHYFVPNFQRTVYTRDGKINKYNPTAYGLWWWSPGEEFLIEAYTNIVVRLDSEALIVQRKEACDFCTDGLIDVRRKYVHENH